MTNPIEAEARQRAWREWSHGLKPTESMSPGACFYAGWDAARQYGEQRLAALVEAVMDEHEDFHRVWAQGYGREGIVPPISECRNPLCRALAGQTEEDTSVTDPLESEAREAFDALRDPPSEVDTRTWRAFDYFKAGVERGRAAEHERIERTR